MALYSITVQVTNSSDNSAVVGARLFTNGVTSATTNSSGSAIIQVTSGGSATLQITATGFQSSTQTINTSPAPPLSIQVSLAPAPVTSQQNIVLQFVPAVAGILFTVTQGPTTPLEGTTLPDGSFPSLTNPVPYGTYSISATLEGYQTLTQSFAINGQTTPYTFTLIENVDTDSAQQGNNTGNSSTNLSAPSSILSQTTTIPPVSSEYIYPNTAYDMYFTITGARIYIGNLFIDECNSIQYALQDNAIPIYGYASRYVDAYGQGRSLVQGQLTLNFVTEGYLYTVMQQYSQLIATNLTPPTLAISGAQSVDMVLGLMTSRDSYLQQAANNPNPIAQAQNTAAANTAQSQITGIVAAMAPGTVSILNAKRQAQQVGSTDVIPFDNAIYQDVLFDIRIEMGNEVTGVKRIRYIEKCKLISNEQVIAPDGQTLLDSYGFIGRRLR